MGDREEWKLDTFVDFAEVVEAPMLVFCRTCQRVEWLQQQANQRGFNGSILLPSMSHEQQQLALREFSGHGHGAPTRFLLTTDGAPLDLHRTIRQRIRVVLNLDMCSPEVYTRRVLSTATAGNRPMVVITFMLNHEVRSMQEVARDCQISVEECPMEIADMI